MITLTQLPPMDLISPIVLLPAGGVLFTITLKECIKERLWNPLNWVGWNVGFPFVLAMSLGSLVMAVDVTYVMVTDPTRYVAEYAGGGTKRQLNYQNTGCQYNNCQCK